ncbi:hypothetical protein AB0P15_36775 [Streptomyces sp. NPDC087917]|uniref:hypothetical protein n=1 Tax=Streptomyces sp. NPDC087917 TaxID=3155060 RepID=UPI003419B8D0
MFRSLVVKACGVAVAAVVLAAVPAGGALASGFEGVSSVRPAATCAELLAEEAAAGAAVAAAIVAIPPNGALVAAAVARLNAATQAVLAGGCRS